MCPSAARGSRFECLDSRLTSNLQQLASPFLLRAYKASKSRWAIRGPEGASRFAGRAQAAEDALETTRRPPFKRFVSLSGPHAETARRLWKLVNLAGNGYFRVARRFGDRFAIAGSSPSLCRACQIFPGLDHPHISKFGPSLTVSLGYCAGLLGSCSPPDLT